MYNTVTESPRVRAARLRECQRTFLLKWVRISIFSTLASLIFLSILYLLKATNQEVVYTFLFGPILLSTAFLVLELIGNRFLRSSWRWNDKIVIISGRPYRWNSFRAYFITTDDIVSGCSTFALQFKNRFLQKGICLSITCEDDDLVALIGTAQAHIKKTEQGAAANP
jgi:hypothetical protein